MEFPQNFIEKVKNEFPKSPGILNVLNKGDDYNAGHFLKRKIPLIDAEDIIEAFNNNEPEKIRELAEKVIRREKLFEEFLSLLPFKWYIFD